MDRFTWAIVAGAIVLVVAGVASVTLWQRPGAPPDLSRPEGVVRAYVEALRTDHPEQAWDLLDDSARKDVTRDEFIRRASEPGPYRNTSRLSIDQVEVEGDTARVTINRSYGSGGGLFGSVDTGERWTVRLQRQGGTWRITVPPDLYLLARRPI